MNYPFIYTNIDGPQALFTSNKSVQLEELELDRMGALNQRLRVFRHMSHCGAYVMVQYDQVSRGSHGDLWGIFTQGYLLDEKTARFYLEHPSVSFRPLKEEEREKVKNSGPWSEDQVLEVSREQPCACPSPALCTALIAFALHRLREENACYLFFTGCTEGELRTLLAMLSPWFDVDYSVGVLAGHTPCAFNLVENGEQFEDVRNRRSQEGFEVNSVAFYLLECGCDPEFSEEERRAAGAFLNLLQNRESDPARWNFYLAKREESGLRGPLTAEDLPLLNTFDKVYGQYRKAQKRISLSQEKRMAVVQPSASWVEDRALPICLMLLGLAFCLINVAAKGTVLEKVVTLSIQLNSGSAVMLLGGLLIGGGLGFLLGRRCRRKEESET